MAASAASRLEVLGVACGSSHTLLLCSAPAPSPHFGGAPPFLSSRPLARIPLISLALAIREARGRLAGPAGVGARPPARATHAQPPGGPAECCEIFAQLGS